MAVRFTRAQLVSLEGTKYLRIRAGPDHRFIHVWVVVVEGRAFVRSWNDKPDGWYRAFTRSREGAIVLDDETVEVVARPVRSQRLLDAVTQASAGKYNTKANRPYVDGFADPKRQSATLELLPE